ncbi:SPASM domain-containing protein, partial [Candidatus Auribacterota bacterium]
MGYTRVVISPDGNASLCGESIGNIYKSSLKKMWYSSLAKKIRKEIRKCPAPCLQFCTIRPESELQTAFDILVNKKFNIKNYSHEAGTLLAKSILTKL